MRGYLIEIRVGNKAYVTSHEELIADRLGLAIQHQ